jgi:cysteine desulfurase
MLPVYLDAHASTLLCPEALEAMTRAAACANAASKHGWGRMGEGVVESARREVADAFACDPECVVFTSGATEGNNLALRGVLDAFARDGSSRKHVVASNVEHTSILGTLSRLALLGRADVTLVPVGPDGIVDPADIARALRPDTALCTVMQAQNEIGTVQPVADIARLCRERQVLFHSDAAQSFGREPPPDADIATVSGHKFHGPQGVGAVYLRPGLAGWIEPQAFGGMHPRGVRAGTANAPGIAGMAAALRMMRREWPQGAARVRCLRDELLRGLMQLGEGRVRVNGAMTPRLPHNLNVSFAAVCPWALHAALRPTIAVSGGAACKTLARDRSHVLDAIGATGAPVRYGLSLDTTEADIATAVRATVDAARSLYGRGCFAPGECPCGGTAPVYDRAVAVMYGAPPPPPTEREVALMASYGAAGMLVSDPSNSRI